VGYYLSPFGLRTECAVKLMILIIPPGTDPDPQCVCRVPGNRRKIQIDGAPLVRGGGISKMIPQFSS
jgi:hypothetical protein